MNPLRLTLLFGAVALLAACATTPEQKAARAQAQKRYEQDLQVNLAAQCDQETAALIRRKFDEEGKPGVATAEQKSLPPQIYRQSFRPHVPSLLQNGMAKPHLPAATPRSTLLLQLLRPLGLPFLPSAVLVVKTTQVV